MQTIITIIISLVIATITVFIIGTAISGRDIIMEAMLQYHLRRRERIHKKINSHARFHIDENDLMTCRIATRSAKYFKLLSEIGKAYPERNIDTLILARLSSAIELQSKEGISTISAELMSEGLTAVYYAQRQILDIIGKGELTTKNLSKEILKEFLVEFLWYQTYLDFWNKEQIKDNINVTVRTITEKEIHLIEDWWRHCGCYDREQASGIKYTGQDDYLSETDNWWNGLTNLQKTNVYEDFFDDF